MFGNLAMLWMFYTAVVSGDTEPLCLSRYDYDYKLMTSLVSLEQQQKDIMQTVDKQSQTILEQEQTLRQHEETVRQQGDTMRQQEETMRQYEETVRQQGETVRQQDETMRQYEDTVRQQEETLRKHAENMRLQEKNLHKQEESMRKQEEIIEKLQTSQEENARALEEHVKRPVARSGSTYVRWGRTTCPDNGTELVYTGYAGGSYYGNKGAAANTLCLPTDPLWGDFDDSMQNHAPVFGAEYEIYGSYSQTLFKKDLGDHDVPCAVCHSVRSTAVMIPARNACYPDWTLEYKGYLTAGHYSHVAATEFLCLDNDPDLVPDSKSSNIGKLIYVAEAVCGSLKCPPYVNGRELTCVVCTQ